ncbi:hypothetical protein BCR39DRAFT_537984 [Naematelia encephala]|uniref:Uncharacterized protein n=1 Tax=Naematelia encephala TaxID=71784 RepID=A0A1Y2AYN5_9TREE|nr:hypothetical protein BCR39DRAFT_537984 [Naematelia encephala]
MSLHRSTSRASYQLTSTSPTKRLSSQPNNFGVGTTSATTLPSDMQDTCHDTLLQLEQEIADLRRELGTAEDLLARSQKDNEQKHEQNEHYKSYVKTLEKLLDDTHTPSWREDINVHHPQNIATTAFFASTPLPKPSPANALRQTASFTLSARRSVRATQLHRASAMDFGALKQIQELKEIPDRDETPTAAMRRLEGRQEVLMDTTGKEASMQTANAGHVKRVLSSSLYTTPNASTRVDIPVDRSAPATTALRPEHVERLISLLSTVPSDFTSRSAADQRRSSEAADVERDRAMLTAERRGMLEMIEAFESRLIDKSQGLNDLLEQVSRYCGEELG